MHNFFHVVYPLMTSRAKKQMLSVISIFSQWYLLEKLENLQPEIADHAKYIWYTSTLVHSQMSKILAEEVNFLQK